MLLLLLIAGAQAVYYPNGKRVQCLDYSQGGRQASATLIKEAVEPGQCSGGGEATFVGFHCNVKACAAAVEELGGTHFKWGGDGSGKFTKDRKYRKSKAGWATTAECWMEPGNYEDCQFIDAQYDWYKVTGGAMPAKARVVKKGSECNSGDAWIGMKGGVLECASAVKARGGKYFIFGRPREGKELKCYQEHTSSASCPEGWESDAFDFWEVLNPAPAASVTSSSGDGYSCRGTCGSGYACSGGQCRRDANTPMTTCRGTCASGYCCNSAKVRCERCGDALAMTTSPSPESSPIVYGFAALGLATLLYGSYKFYCGKAE